MSDPRLQNLIIQLEGLKFKVYDDATGLPIVPGYTVKGHPTIGVGRALDTHGLSKEEAMFLCEADILSAVTDAKSFWWFDSLAEARQAVVVSMVFNLGLGGFKEFQGMINALSVGDYPKAASEMLNSRWASELPNRVQELAQIMISGTL